MVLVCPLSLQLSVIFEPPHELRCRIVTKPFDLRIPPWGLVFRAAADGDGSGGGGGRIQL